MGDRSRADGNLAPIGVIIDDPGQFGACHRPIWRTWNHRHSAITDRPWGRAGPNQRYRRHDPEARCL